MTRKNDHHGQSVIAVHAVAMHGTGQEIITGGRNNGSAGAAILLHLDTSHQKSTHLQEIICRHHEVIVCVDDGYIGKCYYCAQERLYPTRGKPEVIKRGRIGGLVTMVVPPSVIKSPTKVIKSWQNKKEV